ncbi:MAG: hypothetical protein M3525_04255 [Acidobacteriota bacterium]|nr:hypothetical protein [Acidobacteriota bacterium]
MRNYIWMILIVAALTLVGILTLGSMVVRYYWGERGTPPPSTEERRRLRELEEHARRHQKITAKRHKPNSDIKP